MKLQIDTTSQTPVSAGTLHMTLIKGRLIIQALYLSAVDVIHGHYYNAQ